MDCKKYESLLDAFAAGELSGDEASALQAHLDACPPCRAKVDLYRRALVELKAASLDVPSADKAFHRSLSARLDDSDRRTGRKKEPRFRMHFIGSVAAAAAAVLIVANVLMPKLEPTSSADDPTIVSSKSVDSTAPVFVPYLMLTSQDSPNPAGLSPYGFSSADSTFTRPVFFTDVVPGAEYRRLEYRVRELEERIKTLESSLAPAPSQ